MGLCGWGIRCCGEAGGAFTPLAAAYLQTSNTSLRQPISAEFFAQACEHSLDCVGQCGLPALSFLIYVGSHQKGNQVKSFVRFGVWAWGTVTVTLALAALVVVIAGGLSLEAPSTCEFLSKGDFDSNLGRLFYALKENGSLVAGILGFSGLAWSNFFATHSQLQGLSSKTAK
jgi:hypothetical protein